MCVRLGQPVSTEILNVKRIVTERRHDVPANATSLQRLSTHRSLKAASFIVDGR